jgi:NIMA-interacting peptidyl-prolyl cis-trans isomerase 1
LNLSATRAAALAALLAVGCDRSTDAPAPGSATASASAAAPAIASASPLPVPPAPASPPDTVIAQHLLVAYRGAKRAPKGVTRSKVEARARAEEARAKIAAGTTFEDAVAAYSDDAGSAERLGSVGKFHRADMDPAFSAAAFGLKVGAVSDVVETPFGFHVIKRTQ